MLKGLANRCLLIVVAYILFAHSAYSQRATLSTDLLRWTTLSPNIGVELMLSRHSTLAFDASCNPFDNIYGNIKATHIALSPEYKYWFKRPNYSHYLGANIITSIYDLSISDHAAKGRMAAIGVTYGYGFILDKHLSLTPSIGVGYGAFDQANDSSIKFYPTVTKLAISLSYIMK